jgi:hypothetical protein
MTNATINKKLKKMFLKKGITRCELRLQGCADNNMLSFAHRHKRKWYLGRKELLVDYNQVVVGCIPCHMKIEDDAELTEKHFQRLRGEEICQ